MSGFRNVLSAVSIALVILLILIGGFATSFQEAGLFSLPPTEISQGSQSEPVLPILPVELDIEMTVEPNIEFATMTTTALSSSCPIPTDWEIYIVKLGDTVESLAGTFDINPDDLRSNNCLVVDDLIPGSRVYVPIRQIIVTSTSTPPPGMTPTSCRPPSGWIRYTVKPNDTLFSLSIAYGISVAQLKGGNCLVSNLIRAGSQLWVPNVATRTPIPSQTPRPSRTPTHVPPTATLPATATSTLVPPTSTPMSPTPPPPTSIPTDTPVSPSPSPTTPPIPTETATPQPPTSTPTASPPDKETPTPTQ